MKLLIPFTPHLAYECLEKLNCIDVISWPKIEKNILDDVKLAVQINGKTRDILLVKKELNEQEVNMIILKSSKAKKYIKDKKINKIIYIKNRIINYIITN